MGGCRVCSDGKMEGVMGGGRICLAKSRGEIQTQDHNPEGEMINAIFISWERRVLGRREEEGKAYNEE